MRIFVAACIFGLAIASVGCVTDNWSKNLLGGKVIGADRAQKPQENWLQRTIGKGQASDPRARRVEQRLGYSDQLGYD